MSGRRVDLSTLANSAPPSDARVPRFAGQGPRAVELDQVAPNPINTRILDPDSPKIRDLEESLRRNGQLEASTVVSRDAFLRIFPEHEETIGTATYVQVTGGRRRLALQKLGQLIDIAVKEELAVDRAQFLSATAAENLDRQNLNAIEEAHIIALIIDEAGTAAAAAEKLSRTRAWVTQRMNLLKLSAEAQAFIQAEGVPLRDVRALHTYPAEDQLELLRLHMKRRAAVDESAGVEHAEQVVPTIPSPRPSGAAVAVRKLGGTPTLIAKSLRSVLSAEEVEALGRLLIGELGAEG